ncbi:MAG: single-stranded-DNA-specific exonuclease RecJ, partial [Oscillospiraceae bacterium]|nr:single-stranded-DNA-specific exonuclease RecJ [Oscillospiraceae bacterium]
MYSSDFKIPFSRPDVPQALREAGYTPLLAALLGLRGITQPEDAERFLRGGTELLRDPLEMLDMDKAAGRLRRAVEGRERVAVYGDYDVDGITATCL